MLIVLIFPHLSRHLAVLSFLSFSFNSMAASASRFQCAAKSVNIFAEHTICEIHHIRAFFAEYNFLVSLHKLICGTIVEFIDFLIFFFNIIYLIVHLADTAVLITFFLRQLHIVAEADLVAYVSFQVLKNASDSFVYVPCLPFASTLVFRLLVRRLWILFWSKAPSLSP